MNQSVYNVTKRLEEKEKELKRNLTTELALSIEELRKTVEPWVEVAEGKEYLFKKVEVVKGFGVITFIFQEKNRFGDGKILRLNYQLK